MPANYRQTQRKGDEEGNTEASINSSLHDMSWRDNEDEINATEQTFLRAFVNNSGNGRVTP